MLGSDDREEELEADEAVWERLRANAGGKPGQELSTTEESESGSEGYGEEPTGAFDRNDPAIASAFEQEDDYEEPSAIAHSESYELAEDDLESEADDEEADQDEEGDDFDDEQTEHAQFEASDDEHAEDYGASADGEHVEEEEDEEEDEEALWAQARASLELAKRQDEQDAQRAAYAAYERQSLHGHEQFGQQAAYPQGYDAAGFGGQHHAEGAPHDSYEGPDAYQRPSHVTPFGYSDDSFGSRHSDVGPVSSHPQAYHQGEQAGFGDASYAQAASTGFPPAQAPGAFNQQAWAENFDVPDGASKPRGRGASRVIKGLLGAAVVAAAAGAGAYQFVLLPQQERTRAAELAALQAQQQKVIEQERVAKESAARAEAEQRAAAEAALKRAEEAAAAAGGAAADVATTEPEAGKPKSRAKSSDEGGESRAERKARERAERKERREAAKAARAERRERKVKPDADEVESSAPAKKSKKAEKAEKAESQAAAEADNDDPLFGL